MESFILGAQSGLDDFIKNPPIQSQSGTIGKTSRNAYGTNEWTNEDDSQIDLHPEACIPQSQMARNSDPKETHDNHPEVVYFHETNCAKWL